MIKESGRVVRRSGERILGKLEYLGRGTLGILGKMFVPPSSAGQDVTGKSEGTPQAPVAIPSGSPLDNVGPIPDELRKDPFPGGSVPWSIQEAEKEEKLARRILIWKVAISVSWVTTVVAVLRSVGIL